MLIPELTKHLSTSNTITINSREQRWERLGVGLRVGEPAVGSPLIACGFCLRFLWVKNQAFIVLGPAMPLDRDKRREGPRKGSGWWVHIDDRALSAFVAYFPWGVEAWGRNVEYPSDTKSAVF
jgi:hypothetical protein